MVLELLDRDGLARLARFDTPHGPIVTPALLPVVHPDPRRQPVSAPDLRRRFGFSAVITSSYIGWRSPPLRERLEREGFHRVLGFDGPIMTDSGAFQQHAYGDVEVRPDVILNFQRRSGSDLVTVLDEFTEPSADRTVAERAIDTTMTRARAARELHRGILVVPVQGGSYADLRFRAASEASEVGDVLAVGGVVPLLEQYRFADLARALLAARPALAPERAVHLFGAGHPMLFAFGALFGVDLFDSASYHKFARRGDLMFPYGTVSVDSIRESICRCMLCAARALTEVAKDPVEERVLRIAEHNLLMCAQEIAVVRQAIRDGSLWELAERRAGAHPALFAGLRAAMRGVRAFLPTEPASRGSFRYVGALTVLRPANIRFRARVEAWESGKGPFRPHPLVPLSPAALARTPASTTSGETIWWQSFTGLGAVPLELTELYPVGVHVGPEEFDGGGHRRVPLAGDVDLSGLSYDADRDWSEAWTLRQIAGVLEWAYGAAASSTLIGLGMHGERSPRSGRLRAMRRAPGPPDFRVGPDGLPRPTWPGASVLHELLPFPQARIIVAPDAVEFVREGRSLFSSFVRGGDSGLVPGASALLVDPADALLAVGQLVLAPTEMGRIPRGVAVRVTGHARTRVEPEEVEGPRLGESSAPPGTAPDDGE
ncbi:MAG TPA: tRNA guanosine(15) transglycosylase TgtA [Thermoplasmata archaeon]|nr:tRNA guanosine(15) transglycosylase TgtA [Thermoplasmata archaeon]